ncbi:hypothetical protein H072_2228 [Dactylellina haptotyla CBS 200.50]|uniref:Uncharacterized protein n=1 Tax=Dactylellina haptotyla (strain CBS 200.50) TaxID=1284197 RepID=S8AS17_DACHA|nr:hypothetical protein H072_2228 [Dactylellina haptotyla CBS 200.50]
MTHLLPGASITNITTPAQLCAKFDKGGGSGLQGTFAIYSVASLGNSLDEQLQKCPPALRSKLDAAAAAVADRIPIYYQLSDIRQDKLISLPSSSSIKEDDKSPYPRLPWFLINAAIAHDHCVVGQRGVVETLLGTLRRPWCILEVCCCDYGTVSVMLDFAVIAQQISPELYAAAVLLLSHEKLKRSSEKQIPLPPMYSGSRSSEPSLGPLREVYNALSADGIRSHNPFWLRVICICGIQLGIAVSDLLRVLCAAKGVYIPENMGSPVRVGGLRRAVTEDLTSVRRRIPDHEQRTGFQSHSQRLVSLYRQVLQRLTEEVL